MQDVRAVWPTLYLVHPVNDLESRYRRFPGVWPPSRRMKSSARPSSLLSTIAYTRLPALELQAHELKKIAVCMRAGGGGFDQFRMRLRVYCLAWVYGSNGAKKPRRDRVLWSRTHLIHDVRIYVVRDEKYFSEFRGKSVSSFLTARDGTRNFRLNGEGSVHPCWTSWRTPFTCSGHQRVKAQLRKVRSQSNQQCPNLAILPTCTQEVQAFAWRFREHGGPLADPC